jgi:hypothetical protein
VKVRATKVMATAAKRAMETATRAVTVRDGDGKKEGDGKGGKGNGNGSEDDGQLRGLW